MVDILDQAADDIHEEQDVRYLGLRSLVERNFLQARNGIQNVHAGDGLVNAADTVAAARANLRWADDDVIIHGSWLLLVVVEYNVIPQHS